MLPFPDFGDVQDNDTALHIAMHEIKHGDMAWGCEVLVQLRDYIYTKKEVKSRQWILPQVEAALQRLGGGGTWPPPVIPVVILLRVSVRPTRLASH